MLVLIETGLSPRQNRAGTGARPAGGGTHPSPK
jgi:hypothetical protein